MILHLNGNKITQNIEDIKPAKHVLNMSLYFVFWNFFKFAEWLTVNIYGESWKIIETFLAFVYLVKLLSNC